MRVKIKRNKVRSGELKRYEKKREWKEIVLENEFGNHPRGKR